MSTQAIILLASGIWRLNVISFHCTFVLSVWSIGISNLLFFRLVWQIVQDVRISLKVLWIILPLFEICVFVYSGPSASHEIKLNVNFCSLCLRCYWYLFYVRAYKNIRLQHREQSCFLLLLQCTELWFCHPVKTMKVLSWMLNFQPTTFRNVILSSLHFQLIVILQSPQAQLFFQFLVFFFLFLVCKRLRNFVSSFKIECLTDSNTLRKWYCVIKWSFICKIFF